MWSTNFHVKICRWGEEGKSAQRGNPLGRQGLEPLRTRADLRFSRGGGADFQKTFENFDDLFICFRSTIKFPSSPKALKRCYYGQMFCAACNFFLKNTSKNRFGALFGKIYLNITAAVAVLLQYPHCSLCVSLTREGTMTNVAVELRVGSMFTALGFHETKCSPSLYSSTSKRN